MSLIWIWLQHWEPSVWLKERWTLSKRHTHFKDCILANDHRQHNQCERRHQRWETRDPNWSINHLFRQCLFSFGSLRSYSHSQMKAPIKKMAGNREGENRQSLHRASVFAFGEVGDCLGLPLGGINYKSFLKGPLWSSLKSARQASSRGISHYSFLCPNIKLSLSFKTFPYLLPEWKCGAFEMLLPNFNCPARSFFLLCRMYFQYEKHMLLLKKRSAATAAACL